MQMLIADGGPLAQAAEARAAASDEVQDLKLQVSLALLRDSPRATLALCNRLEPPDTNAPLHHEYCYFREEVQACVDHNLRPQHLRALAVRHWAHPRALRMREQTGSRFNPLSRRIYRHKTTAAHLRAHASPRAPSGAAEPVCCTPAPRMPNEVCRGYYRAVHTHTC